MKPIGIVAALPAEGRTLALPAHRDDTHPALQLRICGIGPGNAYQAANELLAGGARGLVSWGCAAGLTETARSGDLYLPTEIIDQARQQHFQVDAAWHARLDRQLQAAARNHSTQTLVSVTTLLDSRQAKAALQQQSGAAVADMESAAIARAAAEYGRPFLCVRAVADNLDMAVPKSLLQVVDAHGNPHSGALLSALLRQPGLLPTLLRLGRAFAAARKTLRTVAAASDNLTALDDNT